MKKIMMMLAFAIMGMGCAYAQKTELQIAKERAQEQKEYMKMLNAKPCKDAKKQAKEWKKEGWKVTAGGKTMEKQINESMLLDEVYMQNEVGAKCKRYIQHTAMQTAGTYNAGYAAARNIAATELGGMLQTKIAAAMQSKLDNAQASKISATTVDKFNQRQKSIIDATLTNTNPVIAIYREVGSNYQVQVRIAFDKQELAARMKRKLQQELEEEGDELFDIVDEVLLGDF